MLYAGGDMLYRRLLPLLAGMIIVGDGVRRGRGGRRKWL